MHALERVWRPSWPVDIRLTWGPLRRGHGDPTFRVDEASAIWRTMRTPDGPATQRVMVDGPDIRATAWGSGADWANDRLPLALGAMDDVSGFDPSPHPLVARQWRQYGAGLRTPGVGLVLEMLVAAILEQRVTGGEARSSWSWLLRTHGEPAPGPIPSAMYVFPDTARLRSVPSWDWHRAGVDPQRSATVMRALQVANRIEECVDLSAVEATLRLRMVPGIGGWTAAEVAQRSLGDADAVSFGDFHIAKNVVYAMTGELDGDDDRLAELLEPWRGHRGRVVRLVELSAAKRPPRGPRYTPHDFRGM